MPKPYSLTEHDRHYTDALQNIQDFFRYEKRTTPTEALNDDWYAKVAEVMKNRIDHELKHLHSPYLD